MERVVSFAVDGRPVPKGRPRVTRHGTYTPKSTQIFENAVRAAWLECGERPFEDGEALEVMVNAYFPIPSGTPKRKRGGLDLSPYLKRGDIDNNLETGKCMSFLLTYQYIAEALGVTVGTLLGETGGAE